MSDDSTSRRVIHFTALRKSKPLFPSPSKGHRDKTWADYLYKGLQPADARSKRKTNRGRVQHPTDWAALKRFRDCDPHHSACIEAKINSTVGLGFEKENVAEKLDELCERTWQDVVTSCTEDYWITGNFFIEVVRTGKQITGLHHLPAECVWVYVENDKLEYHYEVKPEKGPNQHFAAFGDKEEFVARWGKELQGRNTDPESVSEVIHIRRPTALSRWYGTPDWLAAVAQIELAHSITQYNYDFFLNSGVPEFVLLISGANLGKEWDEQIKPALQNMTGVGNHHKTLALNVPDKEVELQVEKLGEEMAEGWFESMLETVAARIVSAHRVPPLIAGIQTPGKLGANNEFINAMWMFQSLVIAPAQNVLESGLANTLGSDEGVTGLSGKDAFELKEVTAEVPVAQFEAPGSVDEPAKQRGSREDVPGTSLSGKEGRSRQNAVSKLEDKLAKMIEDGLIEQDVAEAIMRKAFDSIVAKLRRAARE